MVVLIVGEVSPEIHQCTGGVKEKKCRNDRSMQHKKAYDEEVKSRARIREKKARTGSKKNCQGRERKGREKSHTRSANQKEGRNKNKKAKKRSETLEDKRKNRAKTVPMAKPTQRKQRTPRKKKRRLSIEAFRGKTLYHEWGGGCSRRGGKGYNIETPIGLTRRSSKAPQGTTCLSQA